MIKYVLIVLVLGVVAGYSSGNFKTTAINTIVSDYIFNLSLIALLFFMGLLFGADKEAVSKLKKTG